MQMHIYPLYTYSKPASLMLHSPFLPFCISKPPSLQQLQLQNINRRLPCSFPNYLFYPPPFIRPSVKARLFHPAIFDASKLKVLFLVGGDGEGGARCSKCNEDECGRKGDEKEKEEEELRRSHPSEKARAYTLTHSDITADMTLAVSNKINKEQVQGWYRQLQRDEVVAEWRKSQGSMSLHVHCHVSGGHFLLNLLAHLRLHIFRRELPVVLQAFRHGDDTLFKLHPELEESLVWVYFHSNIDKFNIVECWGPLQVAASQNNRKVLDSIMHWQRQHQYPPQSCTHSCVCCFPGCAIIPPSYYRMSSFQDELYINDIMVSHPLHMSQWRSKDKHIAITYNNKDIDGSNHPTKLDPPPIARGIQNI